MHAHDKTRVCSLNPRTKILYQFGANCMHDIIAPDLPVGRSSFNNNLIAEIDGSWCRGICQVDCYYRNLGLHAHSQIHKYLSHMDNKDLNWRLCIFIL